VGEWNSGLNSGFPGRASLEVIWMELTSSIPSVSSGPTLGLVRLPREDSFDFLPGGWRSSCCVRGAELSEVARRWYVVLSMQVLTKSPEIGKVFCRYRGKTNLVSPSIANNTDHFCDPPKGFGLFPHKQARKQVVLQWTPPRYPLIQFSFDTVYLDKVPSLLKANGKTPIRLTCLLTDLLYSGFPQLSLWI
jgi:hypothetical protein